MDGPQRSLPDLPFSDRSEIPGTQGVSSDNLYCSRTFEKPGSFSFGPVSVRLLFCLLKEQITSLSDNEPTLF